MAIRKGREKSDEEELIDNLLKEYKSERPLTASPLSTRTVCRLADSRRLNPGCGARLRPPPTEGYAVYTKYLTLPAFHLLARTLRQPHAEQKAEVILRS